jgi:hypothetical protein
MSVFFPSFPACLARRTGGSLYFLSDYFPLFCKGILQNRADTSSSVHLFGTSSIRGVVFLGIHFVSPAGRSTVMINSSEFS